VNIHAPTLRTALNDLAAQGGSEHATAAGGGAGFASLLRQAAPTPAPAPAAPPNAPAPQPRPAERTATPARATPAASAPPSQDEPAAGTEPDAAPDTAAAAHRSAPPSARSRVGGSANARAREPAPSAEAGEPDPVARVAEAATETRVDPAAQASMPAPVVVPIDPNILQWLAGLQRTGMPHAAASAAGGAGADAATSGAVQATATTAPARPGAELATDVEVKDRSVPDTASPAMSKDINDINALTAAAVEPRTANAMPAAPAHQAPAAMGASAFVPGRPAGLDPAAPVTLGIATPVTTPEFAQALGLQMSVLARDGVQHAELHLNPAEMGPVSVQIVMDGTQARVDFGADLAATRHAIEAGLPELASALRDAGFTLAGGGVSQHAHSRHGGGDNRREHDERQRPATGAEAEDAGGRIGPAVRRIVSAGGIDLFA
jgi:flagellar hook-length control protein FliK